MITVDAPSSEWIDALGGLRTEATRVYARDYSLGPTEGLSSDLPDDEHNAWTERVFDAICAVVNVNIELLDEDDSVIRSREGQQ
ncbi:hypothetical protein WKY82_03180 [Gordonia malaquae]|uniref:hypothetical protein n=1 Tax=Gordonia malaquae TaxID=410332 RepID=UPI0030C79BB5